MRSAQCGSRRRASSTRPGAESRPYGSGRRRRAAWVGEDEQEAWVVVRGARADARQSDELAELLGREELVIHLLALVAVVDAHAPPSVLDDGGFDDVGPELAGALPRLEEAPVPHVEDEPAARAQLRLHGADQLAVLLGREHAEARPH